MIELVSRNSFDDRKLFVAESRSVVVADGKFIQLDESKLTLLDGSVVETVRLCWKADIGCSSMDDERIRDEIIECVTVDSTFVEGRAPFDVLTVDRFINSSSSRE